MTKNESNKLDIILQGIDKVEKLLFGNGEVGLCERVRNLERTRKHFFRLPTSVLILLQIVMSILMIIFMLKK